MVLLTVTPAAKAAIARRCALGRSDTNVVDDDFACRLDDLATVDVGGPVEHEALSRVSKDLISHDWEDGQDAVARQWRLDTLLAGARIYQPAPSAKPEPVSTRIVLLTMSESVITLVIDCGVQGTHETSPRRRRAPRV